MFIWIEFPAGILQGQFLSASRPEFANYGAIGQIIGHEITHGFDDQGRQFDEHGNLVDWWKTQTKDQFLNRSKCIIDQYSNFTDSVLNMTVRCERITKQFFFFTYYSDSIFSWMAWQRKARMWRTTVAWSVPTMHTRNGHANMATRNDCLVLTTHRINYFGYRPHKLGAPSRETGTQKLSSPPIRMRLTSIAWSVHCTIITNSPTISNANREHQWIRCINVESGEIDWGDIQMLYELMNKHSVTECVF